MYQLLMPLLREQGSVKMLLGETPCAFNIFIVELITELEKAGSTDSAEPNFFLEYPPN